MNILSINLHNLTIYDAKSAEAFVNLWMGDTTGDPDYKYEVQEIFTNDHHKMWFYKETFEGKPPYRYYAFIDHQKDKNCVVEIDALSEKYYYKPYATFGKVEFQDICKSFTFINESEARESHAKTPDFAGSLAIAALVCTYILRKRD